ncbi:hypothetical protein QR680_015407 [Steinernema hermaphroditum]|uniref:COP9 signalosome complex subunit 3 N-terminal helical repeats domain-containing protein n=1 Tax=Steinernema hermaphroditum TaxID=289476 RepID=A0AA39H7J7_9BILA|nr:hypothetical protein QR680_015407 [Steinernema hermaphroditum]
MSTALGAIRGFIGGSGGLTYDSYMKRIAERGRMAQTLADDHNTFLMKDSFKSFSQEDLMRALEMVDPRTQTIPFMTLLFVKTLKDVAQRGVGSKIANFMQTMMYVVDRVSQINVDHACLILDIYLQSLEFVMSFAKQPIGKEAQRVALTFVRNGLVALTKKDRKMTRIHPTFFQLCIVSDLEEVARDAIYEDARELIFDKELATFDRQELLPFMYFIHGAQVQLNLQNLHEALHLYLNALMVPYKGISETHLHVYKRFILINFILGRPIAQLPSCLSQAFERTFQQKCCEYEELIKLASRRIYKRNHLEEVRKYVIQKQRVFDNDDVEWLVRRVLQRVEQDMVMSVASTFKKISLEEACKRCFFNSKKELYRAVEQLVESGCLVMDYDEDTKFIRFDMPEQKKINQEALVDAQRKIATLKKAVAHYDELSRKHKDYVAKDKKMKPSFPDF